MALDLLTSSSLFEPSTKNTPVPPPAAVSAYNSVALVTLLGATARSLSFRALATVTTPVPLGTSCISMLLVALTIFLPFMVLAVLIPQKAEEFAMGFIKGTQRIK